MSENHEGEIPIQVKKRIFEHVIKVKDKEDDEGEESYETLKREKEELEHKLHLLAQDEFNRQVESLKANYPSKASEIALIESPSQLESFKEEMLATDKGDFQPPPPPSGKIKLRQPTKSLLSRIEEQSQSTGDFVNRVYDAYEQAKTREEKAEAKRILDSLWDTTKRLDTSVLKDRISRSSGMEITPKKKKEEKIEGSYVLR